MTDRVRHLTVTILADNCVSFGEGVLAEHGLSLLAEADGKVTRHPKSEWPEHVEKDLYP